MNKEMPAFLTTSGGKGGKKEDRDMIRYVRIRKFERGLLFREGAIERVLGPGVHLIWDPRWKARVDRVSIREPWLRHDELRTIVRSGVLGHEAVVVELGDHQRAFVWVDGHLEAMLGPGLHALWQELHLVRVGPAPKEARAGGGPGPARAEPLEAPRQRLRHRDPLPPAHRPQRRPERPLARAQDVAGHVAAPLFPPS